GAARRSAGMWRVLVCAGLAGGLAGCAAPEKERLRDYNEGGVYLFRQGDFAGARGSFQAAPALRPEDAGLLYNLGQCYDHLGVADKAEQTYLACLHRSPNHAACRHALTELLWRGGRRTEATQAGETRLASEPKLAAAYAEDGWLWHQIGDLPRAQARLQQALAFDPRNQLALTELALVYEAMQRPERALVLYERLLEQDPHQTDVKKRVNFLLT